MSIGQRLRPERRVADQAVEVRRREEALLVGGRSLEELLPRVERFVGDRRVELEAISS